MHYPSNLTSQLAVMILLLRGIQARNHICPHINPCVRNHPNDYASSYCSSYLSIVPQTTTTECTSTLTQTATTTSFTSTTTVIDDSVYQTCGTSSGSANVNKRVPSEAHPDNHEKQHAEHQPKQHLKPFCFRDFTEPEGISRACSCLHIPRPTETITTTPTAVTTTTTVLAVSTASSTKLFFIDTSNNYHAFDGTRYPSLVTFTGDASTNASYSLQPFNGNDCVLHDDVLGAICVAPPSGGFVECYAYPQNIPGGYQPVVGTLNSTTNQLSCAVGGSNISYFPYGGDGDYSWALGTGSHSNVFNITAFAELPSS